ncbi:hypothetical protein EI94DRAFT_1802230 [Lactarius quietus]|nr:hypothetical protein EI94DRAFT_1802230 [Lactarius quietus]
MSQKGNHSFGVDALPRKKLERANRELRLVLAPGEIGYLNSAFISSSPTARNPTNVPERFKSSSLFQMIRNTDKLNSTGTVSAYSDDVAVFEEATTSRFGVSRAIPNPDTKNQNGRSVGRGSRPKPWGKEDFGPAARIASALGIILDGPLGAAAFNEFGRSTLAGDFCAFAERVTSSSGASALHGYHMPSCSRCVPFDVTLAMYLPVEPRLPVRLVEANTCVFRLPRVSSEAFLHWGPEHYGPLIARNQMVGLWRVSAAESSSGASYSFDLRAGEAMPLGSARVSRLIRVSTPAAAGMAVAESLMITATCSGFFASFFANLIANR